LADAHTRSRQEALRGLLPFTPPLLSFYSAKG